MRCLQRAGTRSLPPALLVHGIGGFAEVWAPVIDVFRDLQPVAVDLPGHGGSSGPLLASAEAYAECLDEVRIALEMESVVVMGQSLGGAVAQAYARRFPATCSGMVIASSAASFAIAPERLQQITDDWPAAAAGFAQRQLSADAGPAMRLEARRLVALRSPAVLAHDLRTCLAFSSHAWAAEVKVPVLLLTGDADATAGPERARELQGLYRQAKLVILDHCGHNAVLQQPHAFAQAVDAFVRALPSA